ncbi:hypothetical protein P153DRAFT_253739, partial [Dothidotthia symphoricarpi CBS 119687]
PQPQTLYFAYGSNLSLLQMSTRCPQATYAGIARLENYKWIINTRGYANIVASTTSPLSSPAPSHPNESTVYGLAYHLPPSNESLLDAYEGVPTAYTKTYLPCAFWPSTLDEAVDTTRAPGEARRVMLVYIDRRRTGVGEAGGEYVGRVNRGVGDAVRLGVPAGWVEEVVRGFV